MNSINWDGFRYFVAAAETGSLSAAAKLLNSNQPTVGRHIDALESALEIKLFQRHAKGLTLTQEGTYVLERSLSMRSLVLKTRRTMQEGEQKTAGIVRVAIPEGLCMEVLLEALPEFYQQYPEINLILNISSSTANLTNGEAELAIRLFRPADANLVVKHIGNMKMGLYASSGYCRRYGAPLKIGDLRQHRTIAYGDMLSSLPQNQWLLDNTRSSLCILRSDSTMTRLKATLMGLGMSIQPHMFSVTNQDLCPLIEDAPIADHEIWLVYHHDLRHIGRVRAVVDFISSKLKLRLNGVLQENTRP